MTVSTVAAGSATISTSETLQSVASSSRSGNQWSGRLVAIGTFASWALPIVLFFPQTFERDQDLLAELEQLVPAGIALVVVPPRVRARGTPPGARWPAVTRLGRRYSHSSSAVCGMIGANKRVR